IAGFRCACHFHASLYSVPSYSAKPLGAKIRLQDLPRRCLRNRLDYLEVSRHHEVRKSSNQKPHQVAKDKDAVAVANSHDRLDLVFDDVRVNSPHRSFDDPRIADQRSLNLETRDVVSATPQGIHLAGHEEVVTGRVATKDVAGADPSILEHICRSFGH